MLTHLSDSSDYELNVIKATLSATSITPIPGQYKYLEPVGVATVQFQSLRSAFEYTKVLFERRKGCCKSYQFSIIVREHSGKNGEEIVRNFFVVSYPESGE
jgi:hypothetical protein